MNNNLTEIVFILDMSGSMSPLKSDVIGGYNSFIGEQKKLPGDALVTLVVFDHEYKVVYSGKPIKDVPVLDGTVYSPRGSTALLDTLGRTINDIGSRLSGTPEEERPGKIIIAINTDGEENCSLEFNREQIKEMITHQSDVYNWEFLFIGANIDVVKEAGSLGIRAINTVSYVSDSDGMSASYACMSKGITSYRNTGTVAPDWNTTISNN
jgi:hypothetical protein